MDDKELKEYKRIGQRIRRNAPITREEKNFFLIRRTQILKDRAVSKQNFKKLFDEQFDSPKINTIKNRITDEQSGQTINLRKNRYKITTKERLEFPCQTVGIFTFKLKYKGKIINKKVYGYSNIIMHPKHFTDEELVKLSLEKAIANFLKSIGYFEGSENIRNRIRIKFEDYYYNYWIDYQTMIVNKVEFDIKTKS